MRRVNFDGQVVLELSDKFKLDRGAQYRCDTLVLTERDELALSRVLQEFEPQTTIFEHDGHKEGYQEFTDMIPNIPHSRSFQIDIRMPSPGQENSWINTEDIVQMWKQSICRFTFDRSEWEWPDPTKKWAFDPPLLGWGEFVAYFPYGDTEMKRFATVPDSFHNTGPIKGFRGIFGLKSAVI